MPPDFGEPVPVRDDVALACRKRHVDRILADNRGEFSRRWLDQVPHGEYCQPDASIYRGADFGVAEIDLRLLQQRLGLQDFGLGGRFVRLPLVERGLRNGLVVDELLAAMEL